MRGPKHEKKRERRLAFPVFAFAAEGEPGQKTDTFSIFNKLT